MKKLLILFLSLSLLVACKQPSSVSELTKEDIIGTERTPNDAVIEAFEQKRSHVFVEGSGLVEKLLPDDNKGSRHQKFLVSISNTQILLFAHNIDLAKRIPDLEVGDTLRFRGEYVYNPKGGVMHWTHKDPQGENNAAQGQKYGWIKHKGSTYE